MSDSIGFSNIDYSEIFLDTSILLNFTLEQDDGSAKALLDSHFSSNIVGKTVKREYSDVKERREGILKSLYQCEDLDNWEVPSSINMTNNDQSWCGELLTDLEQLASRRKIERRLSLEERKISRGWNTLFKGPTRWIETVWPGNGDIHLLGNLRFISNANDRNVICESADWSYNGGAGNLITSDQEDILNNRDRIIEQVDRNRNSGSLIILSCDEFLGGIGNNQ